MKKSLAVLLSLCLLGSIFVGCDKDTDDKPEESTQSPTQITEEPLVTTDAATTIPVPVLSLGETPTDCFKYSMSNDVCFIQEYIGSYEHVVIPSKIQDKPVTMILQEAFCQNSTVVSVVIPDSVTEIRDDAFNECSSLETVILSNNLVYLRSGAFADCTSLSYIRLPSTLEQLETGVFENCTSLKYINIPGRVKEWHPYAYTFENSGLETVELEEGLERIGIGAFCGTKLKSVTLPSSMKYIGGFAFSKCSQLQTVVLNEGLLSIPHGAFHQCDIREIIVPKTVMSVYRGAFIDCESLVSLKFEGNAPKHFDNGSYAINYTIYYHSDAEGFTSPEWNGVPTKIW